MKIHEFSGMGSDFNADVFADVPFVDSAPWQPTRAAAFVALLTEAYPEMTLADIAAFAIANGIPNWEFSIDTADTQLIPTSGNIVYFLEKFPLPNNWKDLFTQWKNGGSIGAIPEDMPVIAPTQPTPAEVAAQSVTAVATPSMTETQQPQTIETTAQIVPETAAPNPVQISTDTTQPGAMEKPGDNKTIWIIIAILAAVAVAMAMKKKRKGKKS
jgi:hypothetical protein